MANLDLTTFNYALKTVYSTGKVLSMVYKDNVALARMPKNQRFPGENYAYAVRYADMTGRSRSFAKARANKNPSKGKKFLLTRVHDYALGSIDTETLLATEGDEGALLDATKAEADSAINALKRSMGIRVFRNGSGKIGQIALVATQASLDTTTLYLSNPSDICNFEVGQKIVFAGTEGDALRDTGKALQISTINRVAGTMVLSAKLNTVAAIDYSDSIFTEGDYEAASDRNMISGYDAWIPATAPVAGGGDSHFNVDRSADVTRLAGLRFTSTTDPGLTTEEAITLVATMIAREGWSPDTCYMSHNRFKAFLLALGTRVEYCKSAVSLTDAKGEVVAQVGFSGVVLHAGKSVIEVFPDQNCPDGTLYVLQNDTWEFKTLGEAPRWISTLQGDKLRTEDSTDSVEFRLAYWGNVRCIAPGANGRYDF